MMMIIEYVHILYIFCRSQFREFTTVKNPVSSVVFFHHFSIFFSSAEIGRDGKATPVEYGKNPPRIMEESGRK